MNAPPQRLQGAFPRLPLRLSSAKLLLIIETGASSRSDFCRCAPLARVAIADGTAVLMAADTASTLG